MPVSSTCSSSGEPRSTKRRITMSLSRVVATAVTLLVTAAITSADDYWVYIGTYTGGPDGSKGIYRAKLKAGELTDLQLAAEVTSPSFLAISPNHKFLYAVSEST